PRPATGGRPSDPRRTLVDRFFRILIATSASRLLRRPVESAPGFPRAMVLTAYFVLSPVTGFIATVATRKIPRHLTPASGRQDHTTSPSAICAVRQKRIRVHRIPSRVRDDRDTPLQGM
ncbi:MAG: hypothetical protein ABI192_06225, partial [Bradyrhizobium sp.]